MKQPVKESVWSIERIKALGFELKNNQGLWCWFRGHGFDVYINLNPREVRGDYFNFHCLGNNHKGYFKAVIADEEEFHTLMRIIQ